MDEFVGKHLELLEIEKEAEIEETRKLHDGIPSKELEQRGLCLRRLKAGSRRTGLYGRTLIKFCPEWISKQLPSHTIDPGDIVAIGAPGDFGHMEPLLTGVVWSTKANSVTVAFDGKSDVHLVEDNTIYSLIKVANNVTYRRLKSALLDLKHYRGGCATPLIDIIFGESAPSEPLHSFPNSVLCEKGLKFFNTSLNESQRNAVEFALCQKEIAVIHGPPGTGKTTTLVEIIRQHIAQNLKVLVCAPSNVAVDNLVEKLGQSHEKVVRLGHPARTLCTNHMFSLDALLGVCDNYELIQDIRKDMDNILSKTSKIKDKGSISKLKAELKMLSRELKEREVIAFKEVLTKVSVILATLTSAHSDGPLKYLPLEYFDLVVIDECSQALEAACWIPLLRTPKVVIAGDHLQLPPTILSKNAAEGGLEVTLMERILKLSVGSSLVKMLTTQYRMHEAIMKWPSLKLYNGKLVADPSVKNHLLRDLPSVEENDNTCIPLLLIDTIGCSLYEMELDDELSKGNEGEACLAAIHVEHLIKSGASPDDIAVVAPYNLQVEMLRSLLSSKYPSLEIKSVDGFQGREKEAVVFTLTRSNIKGEVGFLAEDRRINVAITRARRHLAVICDSETVSHHEFLKELVEYLNSEGEIRSAHQYQDETNIDNYFVSQSEINKYSQELSFTCRRKKTSSKSRAPPSLQVKTSTMVPSHSAKPLNTKTSSKSFRANDPKDSITEKSDLRTTFQQILANFKADDSLTEHVFSSSLTSFERMLVHEIAEKLNLCHISKGEREDRHVTVRKKTPDCWKQKNGRSGNNVQDKHREKVNRIGEIQSKHTDATSCATEVKDKTYIQTVDAHECVTSIEREESLSDRPTKTVLSKSKKKNMQKSHLERPPKDDNSHDLDSFLVDLTKQDNSCHFPKCKTSTSVLGQICSHCTKRYCLGHFIPEVHGCGDLARAYARQQIRKEGIVTPGSGSQNKKPDPVKRLQLERTLEKKLDELGRKRSKKPSKS